MRNISPFHRQRIHKALNDPRYWDKHHPEHAQVFANARRAFEDAYREATPETAPETVHVRAYTRTQDGKEIDVSAYDRTQQIAVRGSLLKVPGRSEIDDVSNNPLHDYVQNATISVARKYGAIAEADVYVTSKSGKTAIPDVIIALPNGRLIVVEVKTGLNPRWTENQPPIYSLMHQGYEVYSNDPRIEKFGFKKGELLPPFEMYVAYLADPNGSVQIRPLGDFPFEPGKRLDNGYKGK